MNAEFDTRERLQIPLPVLRRVATMLLDQLEEREGEIIELVDDQFWSIPSDALYDVIHEPSAFSIARLGDSLEFLESINRNPEDVVAFGLVWFADLARAIGLSRVV